ncbi:MAG: hypothetical protein MO853_09570 [Candidatus Protistobacter heckmanni]|nr:hypothetical protein [Candidatus Protistobacter heckmanni]
MEVEFLAAEALPSARLMAWRAGDDGLLLAVEDARREGMIAVVNSAFRCSESTYFGYVAQDAFAGRNWLALAMQRFEGSVWLLGFNDGKWGSMLAGFGLAECGWTQRIYGGEFFYPGYHSHYADAELTVIAIAQQAYAYDPNSLMVEVDWNKDHAGLDPQDRSLYAHRAKGGFDGRVSSPLLRGLFS